MQATVKMIDFSRTGESFGFYLFMGDTMTRFEHVPLCRLSTAKREMAKLGYRIGTKRYAHEFDLVRSDLGICRDGYDSQRCDVPHDQCPYIWSSDNAMAWHVGWYMALTGRTKPRDYKKGRGYTARCNDMTIRADWNKRHGPGGVLLKREY